ncbi:beta-lactamase class A [Arthrobacter sp. B3I9]|uniref:serine hydrolase n=1 Tax=Arthrobacter sp. B3I9 TaxID=3042270 RepID=UPI00279398D7|nr:serine hydrolase [Arthrobacter sp. B3I9]MDQ0848701.1 beta-lactamase class A [Arthrobacter sp. B3I9]
MDERAPHLSSPYQGRHFRRARRFPGIRASLLALGAAVLAVAVAAGVHSAAEARPARGPVPAAAAAAAATKGTPGPAALNGTASGGVDAQLDAEIKRIIDDNGDYQIGVALLDLSGGPVHGYGVEDPFVAASTAKVLAAEAYYSLVESGEASLDDPMGDYTAGFQLKEMIQQSDNDSWSLIMDAVGHAALADYAASMGVDYDPESNALTPAGMARILAGLYTGELLDAQDTAELLSYMQDTNYEALIPAAVPAGVTVFQKYGLLGGELHDAAILEKDGTAYAFVVFTKGDDLASVPARTEVIHQLTEAVTDALF